MPTCTKEFTQGKRANAYEFTHDLVLISEALPHLLWVNSPMHVYPEEHETTKLECAEDFIKVMKLMYQYTNT